MRWKTSESLQSMGTLASQSSWLPSAFSSLPVASTSVMLMNAAKAVWLTGMKSSPVLTTESSDLKVALDVDVRKVVILSDGWKRGSSGS